MTDPDALKAGLKNLKRTASRRLDRAGVPDELQGLTPQEVEERLIVDQYIRSWGHKLEDD